MRLTQDDNGRKFIIHGFTSDFVRVNDQQLEQSFLLTPDDLYPNLPLNNVSDLEDFDRDRLLADDPEVIIIGTGQTTARASGAFQADLMRSGIGIEFMDTGAACRTFTVLASELRRVSLLVLF